MTCREKLAMEHPEEVDMKWFGGCNDCPASYGYASTPEWCAPFNSVCTKCWDREVDDITVKPVRNTTEEYRDMDLEMGLDNEEDDRNEEESIIKDKECCTETDAGNVTDIPKGNGRCDLLPARVLLRLAMYYEVDDPTLKIGSSCQQLLNSAMMHILKYMDRQVDEDHLIAAISDLCMLAWTEENGGTDVCN